MEHFSRGRIDESIMPNLKTVAPVIEIPAKKEEVIIKEEAPKTELKSAEPEKSRRKLSMEMFSRAPLKLPVGTTKAIKPVKYN